MNIRNQKGVTLVELMIGLVLTSMVSCACLGFFITLKRIFLLQHDLNIIQENARVVEIILGKAVRSSGSFGCSYFRSDIPMAFHGDIDLARYDLIHSHRVFGYEGKQKDIPRMKEGSHVLWLKNIKKPFILAKETSYKSGQISVRGHHHLKKNQVMVIADCSQIDFLKILDVEEQGSVTKIYFAPSIIMKVFYANATIGLLSSTKYYIGNTGRIKPNGKPVFSLYSSDVNGRTLELVEGVEDLKIQYGIENEGGTVFVPSGQIKDWEKVSHIRVQVLFSSNQLQPKGWMFEWPIKGSS